MSFNEENMEQFDEVAVDQLEGKPLMSKEETVMGEGETVKKAKFPIIVAVLIGIVCVLVVGIMMAILYRQFAKKQQKAAAPQTNILAGTSWIADNDGSQWVFDEDQSFHWYQTKEVTDDNYYAGTYEFHIGQDAITYLTNELSEYGVTEEEIQKVISGNGEYTRDNFVCFSTTNQSFMIDGQEQLSDEMVTSYFGFLLQNGTYLNIANMNTGTYYGFTKE